jgi:ABC-type molybdenum transport system ATPase subunit/photorepair protein PhrA
LNDHQLQSTIKSYLSSMGDERLLLASGSLNSAGTRVSSTLVDLISAILDGQTPNAVQATIKAKHSANASVRLEAIELSTANPVGPFYIDGLAKAHTLLIVGPNGAGKSSLLKPLQTNRQAGGKAKCVTAAGTIVDFDCSGVHNNIAFVTSVDLLSKIDSLGDALSIAAGASRFNAFVKVIKDVSKQLTRKISAPASPASWVHNSQFIEKDKLCGTYPRTMEHYVSLGTTLSNALNCSWTHVSLDATEQERLDNEAVLHPKAVEFAGRRELTEILNTLETIHSAGPNSDGLATRAEQALAELETECRKVINDYAIDVKADNVLALSELLIEWLLNAIHALEELINARNLLDSCRTYALQFIAASHIELRACPICDSTIDAKSVSTQLRSRVSVDAGASIIPDPELDALEALTTAMQLIKASRYKANSLAGIAEHTWSANLQTIKKVIKRLGVVPANWHEDVKVVASELKRMCECWTTDFTQWSVTAEVSALMLRDYAITKRDRLLTAETHLNNGHEERLKLFNQLQALGALLWIRHELNRTPWMVDAEQERKNQILRQCICELEALSNEYAEMADNAIKLVMTADVQTRFIQMLNKMSRVNHPNHVIQATFEAGSVTNGTSDLSNCVSEGQRVLINCAARLTVASVVIGHEDHKPGWIVFDEPTNGLDPEAVSILAEYLGSFSPLEFSGQIIVSTFDKDFASMMVKQSTELTRNVKQINLRRFNPSTHTNGLQPISVDDYVPVVN